MYNGFSRIGQIEQVEQRHTCETSEESGQRHGHPVRLPHIRDRIALYVGALLIELGKRMTASSTKRIRLSEEPA